MQDLFNRRQASLCIAITLGLETSAGAAPKTSPIQDFSKLLERARTSRQLLEKVRGEREYEEFIRDFNLERAPSRSRPSTRTISQKARDLITTFEVTSAAAYRRLYQRPIWPKGSSGITIGVGYDTGYVTEDLLRDDWSGYLSDDNLSKLSAVCNLKGKEAGLALSRVSTVVIPWESANDQFARKELPRWTGVTEQALPNAEVLNADCLGALVSLTFNRGPSFGIPPEKDPTGRFKEMRSIKQLMADKELSKIPDQIRSMKRIWKDQPDMRGLLLRRDLEAKLFQIGLEHA